MFVKSNAAGIFMSMTRTKRVRTAGRKKAGTKRSSAGPISFFIALFIVALGAIQLVSTFYTYALTLSDLNGLKRQEAALEEQKQDLENEIGRWDDDAYVTAQARERLGFVFPGEQAVRVLHPEAVTGQQETEQSSRQSDQNAQSLPWYEELAYAFEKADGDDSAEDTANNQNSQGNNSTTTGEE